MTNIERSLIQIKLGISSITSHRVCACEYKSKHKHANNDVCRAIFRSETIVFTMIFDAKEIKSHSFCFQFHFSYCHGQYEQTNCITLHYFYVT